MTETAQTVKEITQLASSGISDAVTSIMPYLEKVAEQMGTTAKFLWMLQIKQGYILGATLVIKYISSLIVITYFWNKFSKAYVENKWGECSEPYELLCLPLLILAGVWIISFYTNLNLMLTLLFNTEYWAIQQIILLIKANVTF